MNNEKVSIPDYAALLAEKERLEHLIRIQKNIIRHDLDELKMQFRKEIRPAIDAAGFIKKIMSPDTRKSTLLYIGANFIFDLVFSGIFRRSHILVRLFAPRLMKKYAMLALLRLKAPDQVIAQPK